MSSTSHTPSRSPWAQRLLTPVARAAGRLLNNGRNDGPPDLDELWRDFNRKLSGLFGGRPGGSSGSNGSGGSPDMKGAGIGVGLIAGVVALGWLASGFFIVQEGQQGVITSFGKYSKTVEAGFQWRLPYPLQQHEIVSVTQLQQVDVGRNSVVAATGLRDSSMLTQDENIVDIRFTVQYTIKDARDFLYENREPKEAVTLAAESAVREIVGKSTMDSVLYEQRDAIATELVKSIQTQLDRLKAGILIKNVNVQSVQPPEQVQSAFEDAFKAGQNKEQTKNEAQAYANEVIPRAQGESAKLREQAEGYKARVIATAEGDGQRFKSVLAEYQKAPQVTRDRIYIDTMQQIYSSVSKVMVDSRTGSNMLYLPLDKLLQQGSSGTVTVSPPQPTSVLPDPSTLPGANDLRSRDNQRSRDGR
ncbi:FtsH protease activity modulator HflK [Roseateles saccharophilus]|uniref:Protein HflK n=1 Tax=Roseateles saccharophilus TaxID=304 RepID=A0A4R3ULX5_ROSSA|nr:FtsH protease activity modulator HflK [Roseateles saccharophilus]MDG0833813.1 FtsH protease activity modulator HflK [Roseateles saccharophilus]TCU91561.1 protease FtsH subunit HflK [Roseateles saccharophilus]